MKNISIILTLYRFSHNKLIRFFLVSGLNTAFGYGLFALLLLIGLKYPIALFFSTIVGILFNFKTIGSIVFENHNNVLIFKFIGVYTVIYLFNLGCLTILKLIGVNVYMRSFHIITFRFFGFLLK